MADEIIIVDTSFISRRDAERRRGLDWPPYWPTSLTLRLQEAIAAISPVTQAEIMAGAYRARWGERRLQELRVSLGGYILIPIDPETVEEWARLAAEARAIGVALSHNDLWILATASIYRFPVATCDRDFARLQDCVACEIITLPSDDSPTSAGQEDGPSKH